MKSFRFLVLLLFFMLSLPASRAEAGTGSWPHWMHRNHGAGQNHDLKRNHNTPTKAPHAKKLKSHPRPHTPKS
jgi:hypothetical protein